MTSAVAAPTRPSSATANRAVGASSRVSVGKTAPGRSKTAARIFSKSGRRSVMTGTNCPSGAASTSATISSAAIPVACPSAAARAGRSVTWALSTPTLTTSVGVNSGAPVASVIGARSARLRVSSEVLPLAQLRVHQRRLGDHLPRVAVLPQIAGWPVAPVGCGGEVPGGGPGHGGRGAVDGDLPDPGAQRRAGEVGRGLLQQRGGRVRVGGGGGRGGGDRRPPMPRGRSSPRRARRPRRCRSRHPGRAGSPAAQWRGSRPVVFARAQSVRRTAESQNKTLAYCPTSRKPTRR